MTQPTDDAAGLASDRLSVRSIVERVKEAQEREFKYEDIEKAMAVMAERANGEPDPEPIIVPNAMHDMLVKFTAESYLAYKALPWYRKLIYKWNMWRTKV